MKNANSKKISLGRGMVAVFCFFLMIASMTTAIVGIETQDNTEYPVEIGDSLSYTFAFSEPSFDTIGVNNDDYTRVHMSGCIGLGKNVGEPTLPVKFIKLLVPPKKSIKNVEITGLSVEFDLGITDLVEKPVVPYQNPVPIGSEPEEFEFNTDLYSSDEVCPSEIYGDYSIGYSHGYAILSMPIQPLQYIPSEGILMYYPEIIVTLELEDTEYVNPFYRDNSDDKEWVENLVWNPEIAEFYTPDLGTLDYPGGLCDPADHYDYVIITTEDNGLDYWSTSSGIPYNWEDLMDKHAADDGFSCTLVTEQDIFACEDYENSNPLFNDIQARIREFCKDAYEDWGTSYVLIGADGEWIPARVMRYEYESNVEADIYWSNLDNNFNQDMDNYWGEEGDLGFDLYAELYIGRLTCDEPQDISNWMTKSFYYADSSELEYLDSAAFYGGNTGWTCQGDDFIDYSAIKGTDDWLGPYPGDHGPYPSWLGFQYGFETWNDIHPGLAYDLSVAWTAEPPNPGWQGGSESAAIAGLKTAINEDRVTLISGIAHADSYMSLDVDDYDWEANYHNTKPFLIHDYGCHCGDFYPTDDGVLHSMLFHSDTELAFACIYHTSYGWGSQSDTNSSSALQMKLFWDYFFDIENNSGGSDNWQLGRAMAWSKDSMAPTINWTYYGAPGSWRCTIQACLLFGDPAQRLKLPNNPPEKPDRPSGETLGVTDIEYTYTTSTTDVEGEQIWYMFDWGDGEYSDWIGPYNSGVTGEGTHSWLIEGDYDIMVKAKDVNGGQSAWSDPLSVTILKAPVLRIQPIKGGLFRVSAEIRNEGAVDAIGVEWEITLEGGTIFLGRTTTGKLLDITPGEGIEIQSNPIIGLGEITVKVTAEVPESSCIRHQGGRVFFIYVYVNPGGG